MTSHAVRNAALDRDIDETVNRPAPRAFFVVIAASAAQAPIGVVGGLAELGEALRITERGFARLYLPPMTLTEAFHAFHADGD